VAHRVQVALVQFGGAAIVLRVCAVGIRPRELVQGLPCGAEEHGCFVGEVVVNASRQGVGVLRHIATRVEWHLEIHSVENRGRTGDRRNSIRGSDIKAGRYQLAGRGHGARRARRPGAVLGEISLGIRRQHGDEGRVKDLLRFRSGAPHTGPLRAFVDEQLVFLDRAANPEPELVTSVDALWIYD
jgi:hypothetical protein